MGANNIQKGLKFIHCNEITIAASCEDLCLEEIEYYYPSTFLIFVESGTLHIRSNGELLSYSAGEYCLVRKYTVASFSKTFTQKEGAVKTYVFALPDKYIRKVLSEVKIDKAQPPIGERVVSLPATSLLNNTMQSVKSLVDKNNDFDRKLLEEKVKEALLAITKSNQKFNAIFKEYSLADRADLADFIEHHYLINIPLPQLAKQSGRSLSTFNREFKLIFNSSPHKWIHKKRLEKARQLLINSDKNIGEIYQNVGFEDFGHFSKSFKKMFGLNPSKLKGKI